MLVWMVSDHAKNPIYKIAWTLFIHRTSPKPVRPLPLHYYYHTAGRQHHKPLDDSTSITAGRQHHSTSITATLLLKTCIYKNTLDTFHHPHAPAPSHRQHHPASQQTADSNRMTATARQRDHNHSITASHQPLQHHNY